MSNPFEHRVSSPSAVESTRESVNPFVGRVRVLCARDVVERARVRWSRMDVRGELDEIDAERSSARADGRSVWTRR